MLKEYTEQLITHYQAIWSGVPKVCRWEEGPFWDLPSFFQVVVFPPSPARNAWTYATCCMSLPSDDAPLELHLLSPIESEQHVELLTIVAHYHRTGASLCHGHTVNFGRPWLPGSTCHCGLVSLPYLDGPRLETMEMLGEPKTVRFLWLIPITEAEREFKMRRGLEALERRFEEVNFDYLDHARKSAVDE